MGASIERSQSMNQKSAERRVLIVDDERDFAESLVDILESRGYTVVVAHNSEEALEKLPSFRPHCALVDLRLGTEDGIDLLKTLKEQRPEMPCILMTAYASTDSAIEALHRGAYDYLRKPIEARDLLATIDRSFDMIRLMEERDAAHEALRIRNEELRELNSRLRQMVESAQSLASCRNLEELSRKLLERFASLMVAEGGSLYLVREEELVLLHSLDAVPAPGRLPLPLREGSVFHRILRDRKPVLVKDITLEDLLPIGGEKYRDGSLFALPLFGREGEVLAIISLHNRKWPPFTPQDREIGQVMLSLSSEILRSQQVTEKIRTSLKEKEVLLKEIHHRVKNNLQVISGLLSLQAFHIRDEEARRIYRDSQSRLNSMALIHEQLYQTEDLAKVPFGTFLRTLADNLMRTFGETGERIQLVFDLQEVDMAVDSAIPCGLIINELVTNALSHAFPEGREGRIRIQFLQPEPWRYRMIVSDDGIGLPKGFDLKKATSMGFQLVGILAEQLGSETVVSRNPETSFSFTFREYVEAGTELF